MGKTRNSYYAVVTDKGVVEDTSQECLDYSGEIDGHKVEVVSSGYNAGKLSSILVDGVEYSKNKRGMNIVVLEHGEVAETVSFDTYAFEMNVS